MAGAGAEDPLGQCEFRVPARSCWRAAARRAGLRCRPRQPRLRPIVAARRAEAPSNGKRRCGHRLALWSHRRPPLLTSCPRHGLAAAGAGETPSLSPISWGYNELTFAKACCHRFCPHVPARQDIATSGSARGQRAKMAEPSLGYRVRRRLNINGDLPPMNTQRLFPRKRRRACHNNPSKSAIK